MRLEIEDKVVKAAMFMYKGPATNATALVTWMLERLATGDVTEQMSVTNVFKFGSEVEPGTAPDGPSVILEKMPWENEMAAKAKAKEEAEAAEAEEAEDGEAEDDTEAVE